MHPFQKCQQGRDGKMPFETLHGKKPTDPIHRLNPRYKFGIWLGMRNKSAECLTGNAHVLLRDEMR